jgi:hypothetical protein
MLNVDDGRGRPQEPGARFNRLIQRQRKLRRRDRHRQRGQVDQRAAS